jgi:hypothetical protein
MSVKKFLLKPVKWLTWTSSTLAGVTAVEVALTGAGVHLPTWVAGYTAAATAVVTAVLGAVAYGKVTPLARPRTADGRALVAPSQTQ